MVAYTGDPAVDFVLSRPEVQRAIAYGRVNRRGHVPLLAGADEHDDSLSHVDSRFPTAFPRGDGTMYSPDPHLHVHETVEKWVQEHGAEPGIMERLGLTPDDVTTNSPDGKPRIKYRAAHYKFATPAEKASVEADSVRWAAHNAHIAGAYGALIKGQPVEGTPTTLYDRPYRDDRVKSLLAPSKDADPDSGGGLLGASPSTGYLR